MNLVEVDRALRKLRLPGMADVLETLVQGSFDERAKIDGLVRNWNDCLGNQIENWRDELSSLAISFESLEDRNNRMKEVR